MTWGNWLRRQAPLARIVVLSAFMLLTAWFTAVGFGYILGLIP